MSESAGGKPTITFKCDTHPSRPTWIRATVPHANIEQTKAEQKKAAAGSQKGYDELLAINNTFARMRHDMNRLAGKAWSTTKAIQGLERRLRLYVVWNNKCQLR